MSPCQEYVLDGPPLKKISFPALTTYDIKLSHDCFSWVFKCVEVRELLWSDCIHPNSYVEILIPKAIVRGQRRAFERGRVHEGETLIRGVVSL